MHIFGIGLNKTGTTSLTEACQVLGFRSMHHHGLGLADAQVTARVERAMARDHHPFRYAARLNWYRGFFDLRVVNRQFEYFDRFFPGSKFILHTREIEAWLDSREKHVRRNAETGQSSWTTVDRDGWRTLFEDHTARVNSYFAARPGDLLTFDVQAGDGWDTLCPFLGVDVPATAFPFANRAPSTS